MSSSRTPVQRMDSSPIENNGRKVEEPKDLVEEKTEIQDDFEGGVSVIKYITGYSGDIRSLLEGLTIRKMKGIKKKFTCHGFSNINKEILQGKTANGKSIEAQRKECGVWIKDNKSNVRLQLLVSSDNLKELHYLNDKFLKDKWRLVFLGQNADQDTLEKFRDRMVAKCGKSMAPKIELISNETELNFFLPKVEQNKQILLCVLEKNEDIPFYSALKQEAELEKGILTKCCDFKTVKDYLEENKKETTIITNLYLDMIAKLGAYKEKACFHHSALPSRFGGDCKVMYLGCKLLKSDPQVTVMVGNIGHEAHSASQYKSRVASGVDIEKLPDIFSELLQIYKEKVQSLPDRIIFFREGFIEGPRVEEALKNERNHLREKVNELAKHERKYVRITFIVRRKKGGTISVSIPDRKARYRIFSDENGLSYSEFETLIRNLSYSWRYPEPLPAYYATRAAKLAQVYLKGKNDLDKNKMGKIADTIDRSLYVIGERKQQFAEEGNGEEMKE